MMAGTFFFWRGIVLLAGFFFDMLLGDPLGKIHPVRLIGWMISRLETVLYHKEDTPRKKRRQGALLVVSVLLMTGILCGGILYLSFRIHFFVGLFVDILLSWSALSARDLKVESMRVYDVLRTEQQRLTNARKALSRIVGRDTEQLSEEDIIRATVETIAENTSDGEVAPLFYLALGGSFLAMLYKAINTMDSMIGYQNERYQDFGTTAAKLDDVVNFLPARLAGILTIAAAWICGKKMWREKNERRSDVMDVGAGKQVERTQFDAKNAAKIFRRDRNNHESPNAGQTESAFAGALHIRLGGAASYFGTVRNKTELGDDDRKPTADDIRRANVLLYGVAYLAIAVLVICFGAGVMWSFVSDGRF